MLSLKVTNLKHKAQALTEESIVLLSQKKFCESRGLLLQARDLLSAWRGPVLSHWGRLWALTHYQLARVADEQAYNGFYGLSNGADHGDDSRGLTAENLDVALDACKVAADTYAAHFADADCSDAGDARILLNNLVVIRDEMNRRVAKACASAARRAPTRLRDRWLWARVRQLRELPRDRTSASQSNWRDEFHFMLYYCCDDERDEDPSHERDWKHAVWGYNVWLTGPWVGPIGQADYDDLKEFHAEHNSDGLYPPSEYTFTCPGCSCSVGEYGFLGLEYMTVTPGGLPDAPVIPPPGEERPTLHTCNRIVHRLWCPSCCDTVLDAAFKRTIARFGVENLACTTRRAEKVCSEPHPGAEALIRSPPWRLDDLQHHGYRCCFSLTDAIVRVQQSSLEDRIYYTIGKENAELQGGQFMHEASTATSVTSGSAHGCAQCRSAYLEETRSAESCLPPKLMQCAACAGTPYLGPWYCSRQCQKLHWKSHKPTCRRTLAKKLKPAGGLFPQGCPDPKSKTAGSSDLEDLSAMLTCQSTIHDLD